MTTTNSTEHAAESFYSRVLPIFEFSAAFVFFLIAIIGLIVIPEYPSFKPDMLLLIPFMGALGLAFLWMARKSMCSLRITGAVEHLQSKRKNTYSLDKALHIYIHRSFIMPSSVSAYLVVNESGRERALLFSQYYLFGKKQEQKTEQLAELLNIKIKDPLGSRWRESPWYLSRLLGKGELWKFWVLLLLISLPFVAILLAFVLL